MDLERERRRQAALRRLGSGGPCCVACGERDERCLELHHLAGAAHDTLTVILCRNCHRKQTDASANEAKPSLAPIMEDAARLLLGLADLLEALLKRLRSYGEQLLAGATLCPWPYGWVGAPNDAPA
jgi:hypothetical protein